MSIQIKICGLSTPESMTAAIEHGATHVGLVFFEKSPRHVTIEMAAYLANFVPDHIQTVGLFVNPDDQLLERVLNAVKINMIQLHGEESPERCAAIKEKFALPLMKALPIESKEDLNTAQRYEEAADYFLFDAKADSARTELPGGNGIPFDWIILDGYMPPKPYFLAGGLTPDNVRAAIKALRPFGVDVSSGVEGSAGIKDTGKIASFLDAVKSA